MEPGRACPRTIGTVTFIGGLAATGGVVPEYSTVDPAALVAVTRTKKRQPTSVFESR
jgi:hypothetical protein